MTGWLILVGLNHKTAPIEVRERLSVSRDRLPSALAELRTGFGLDEVVLLCTCNRTEVYAVAGGRPGPSPVSVLASLATAAPTARADVGRAGEGLESHLYSYADLAAARHLFRVACGLDSLVLGESEILGQVKDAYDAARAAGTTGPLCHALFQGALRAGARARSETSISSLAVSVPYVSLGLARKVFADLAGKRALLVGTGDIGRVALRHLAESGLREIVAANRTLERAEAALTELELGERRAGGDGPALQLRAVTLDALAAELGRADIVLVCSQAPGYVIDAQTAGAALAARRGRPLLLIDLGVPRQVDPELGAREGVYLFNLDDLEGVVQANLAERQREAAKVERIVTDEVGRLDAWLRRRRAAPVIRSLYERAEAIRQEELRRALQALGSPSDQDREVLAAFSRRLTNRLLDFPTVTLRELAVQPEGTPLGEALGRVLRGELAPGRDRFGRGGSG